jgi:hypothetical protein
MFKAGKSANISGASLAQFSDEAEAFLMIDGRYDWVTNYSSIKATAKQALADVCSDLIAMKIVNFDMSGYTNIKEATTILDVLRDNIERALKNFRDDKYREVMF